MTFAQINCLNSDISEICIIFEFVYKYVKCVIIAKHMWDNKKKIE